MFLKKKQILFKKDFKQKAEAFSVKILRHPKITSQFCVSC